jgi:signal recognition particle subunit SRP54
MVLAELG